MTAAAATAPATATKLTEEAYTAELAGVTTGAPAGVAETAEGVIAAGAPTGASVGGAGGDATGDDDGDAAMGGVATGAGAAAVGDLAGGAGSGAIFGAGTGPCAAAVTARSATMAATIAKRAICVLLVLAV